MNRYLILGNGAAGATAAEAIRECDPLGQITIVSPERHPMYSRPGLAYVITQLIPPQQIIARPDEWYQQLQLRLLYGGATKLDLANRQIKLDSGLVLTYDRLLIATGSRAARLPYPGGNLDGVVHLDTLDGARDLMRRMKAARRAVVVGSGITALELSEGFAHNRLETHHCVRRGTLWGAVFNQAESDLLAERMTGQEVKIHYNTEIQEVLADRRGHVKGVRLANDETLDCELVGSGIGVRPTLDFVRGAPLEMDRGLLVNEYLETNQSDVYAAGDCAQIWDQWTQKHCLDDLWPTAVAAGRIAGRNMAGAHEAFRKGIPFNACLLFGLHVTAIGQLGGGRDDADANADVLQHMSRGSSEVWATRPVGYASAWSHDGPNSVRLVLGDERLAGALVIGRQTLADPLRDLIDWQVNVAHIKPQLQRGGASMMQAVLDCWRQATACRVPDRAAGHAAEPAQVEGRTQC
jgi:NAD(P)H-nitrite reductase large subunit